MENEKYLYYVTFQTDIGWMGALSSNQGLVKTIFPQKSEGLAYSSLVNFGELPPLFSIELFKDLIHFYNTYFAGQKISYSGKLDFTNATGFQRLVWKAACRIPYGKISSYVGIAQEINRPLAYRAVGNALGRNPLPIIVPCHRVVYKSGEMGGFAGSIKIKEALLSLENSELIRLV
jgi:methylated-DNA-[protein]-cysteine S-methyltransferase